jgi:carbamoyl-phosphate synthase large subunit
MKALLSVGYRLPVKNILISTGPIESKAMFLANARMLSKMGTNLFATEGTAAFLKNHDIDAEILHWPLEKKSPNTIEYIREGKLDLVINIPKNFQEEELTNDYIIRRNAVDFGVPLITDLQLARRFVETLSRKSLEDLHIKTWKSY